MKAYTIALLGALAAIGGAACSDDSDYWRQHYKQRYERNASALETRVRSEVERRERSACESRLTKLRHELAPGEASAAGNEPGSGEGQATPTHQYPVADQPMHSLIRKIAEGRYASFEGIPDLEGRALAFSTDDRTDISDLSSSRPCRRATRLGSSPADGGTERSCNIHFGIEYNRRDNTYAVYHKRAERRSEGRSESYGVRFVGTGQTLAWDTVTGISKSDGPQDSIELVPASVEATYRQKFTDVLQRLEAEADRHLTELARLPTIE